jgi:thioredoxin reductase (NADPH)
MHSQLSPASAAEILDCLIVGAGPAGLSAALHLARFKRKVEVVDAGHSRALWIPKSRNIVFFGEGIAGAEILRRGRMALEGYGIKPEPGLVTPMEPGAWGFRAQIKGASGSVRECSSRFVLLATGAEDKAPTCRMRRKPCGKGLSAIVPSVTALKPPVDVWQSWGTVTRVRKKPNF